MFAESRGLDRGAVSGHTVSFGEIWCRAGSGVNILILTTGADKPGEGFRREPNLDDLNIWVTRKVNKLA